MKSSLTQVSSLERKLSVEIPVAVVRSTFDKVFRQIQKDANIRGFRPGKAPLATIRSLYADKVQQDVAQELIRSHYLQALDEHSLDPITYPEFEFDVPMEEKDFSFTASFEVRPPVELRKYEGVSVDSEKFELEETRVDAIIDNIRNAHASWVDVLEDRPAQTGDQAIIDFTGFLDGQPLENGSSQNFPLELGSRRLIDGFEDGIVGMKIGQEKTLDLKFPDPYTDPTLSGKPVQFKVKLTALKKKELPEINEEFLANKMGGMKSEEDLRRTIREDLEQSEKKRIEGDLKNRLLKQLVKLNPVEVPPSLLREQKASLVEDMRRRMTNQGMSEEEFKKYEEKWDADFEKTAGEMIQSGFIIDAIAEKHGLLWGEEDLQAKMQEYAQQTGIEYSKIVEFYSRPEQKRKLTYMITEEKVIEFLLKSAKINEVEKDKLSEAGA